MEQPTRRGQVGAPPIVRFVTAVQATLPRPVLEIDVDLAVASVAVAEADQQHTQDHQRRWKQELQHAEGGSVDPAHSPTHRPR